MKKQGFHLIVWQEGNFFVAKALENNISSFGKTEEEALKNTKEALVLYYEGEKNSIYNKIQNPSLVGCNLSYA